jgi:ABC-2 type transport system ATP-binding protein
MIQIQDAAFHYSKARLFEGLTLSIPGGNIYGLLGMNGAGKTTLLKILSGQIYLQKGQAEVMGYDPGKREAAMLEQIFYLPEEFYLPNIELKEYLSLNAVFYPAFDREAFEIYSKAFGLDYNKKLSQLSYGQKKKFLLSFGLASNTSLLILDEPTNGLDIPSKSQFRRTIASAMRDDRTFIISTHQVRDMENLIDPIIILHEGKVVFNSPLDDVSSALTLALTPSEPTDAACLYKEQVPGGWSSLRTRNPDDMETNIDLETLFNAVITNPDAVSRLVPLHTSNSTTPKHNQPGNSGSQKGGN